MFFRSNSGRFLYLQLCEFFFSNQPEDDESDDIIWTVDLEQLSNETIKF